MTRYSNSSSSSHKIIPRGNALKQFPKPTTQKLISKRLKFDFPPTRFLKTPTTYFLKFEGVMLQSGTRRTRFHGGLRQKSKNGWLSGKGHKKTTKKNREPKITLKQVFFLQRAFSFSKRKSRSRSRYCEKKEKLNTCIWARKPHRKGHHYSHASSCRHLPFTNSLFTPFFSSTTIGFSLMNGSSLTEYTTQENSQSLSPITTKLLPFNSSFTASEHKEPTGVKLYSISSSLFKASK